MTSPLLPGKWVKTLFLKNFKANGDKKQLNRAADPLYKLMAWCPNVKEASFYESERINSKEWIYFLAALLENTTWKLRSLPICNKHPYCPYYYSCAYHMWNTLTELHLENGMISSRD